MEIIELQNILNKDSSALEGNNVSSAELEYIDNCLLKGVNSQNGISEECFGIYRKFVEMKQDAPVGMKNELFRAIKNYINEQNEKGKLFDTLLLHRFLIVKSELAAESYYNIAENLYNLGETDFVIKFLEKYKNLETNIPLKLLTLANFYNIKLKDYKSAINYYEQYVGIEPTKSVLFTTLGNLYKKAYGDESLKEQIYYFEKAFKLKPNERLILHSLAFDYEKLGDRENADKFYRLLLENNPTDTDYYNYGGFLISCGKLYEGHKYLTHRFNIDDINLQYPSNLDISKKYDFKTDLSDKIILVHYEQGFGDTFMYCRFIPLLKGLAKKVIFVVQDNLYELLKYSSLIADEIELFSDKSDISNLEYDYNIALIDLPYLLKVKVETIPYSEGYLEIPQEKVENYKNTYIKNSNNLKVGIAYRGNKNSNYKGRDISFGTFSSLLEMKNIDFYSFDMENENNEHVTNLSHSFDTFTNTACALKSMDLVITTDNVILNLAGALGVQTIGLFNKYPNFRWFNLSGEDVGYYRSVKPLQVGANDLWTPVISEVINLLNEIIEKTCIKN